MPLMHRNVEHLLSCCSCLNPVLVAVFATLCLPPRLAELLELSRKCCFLPVSRDFCCIQYWKSVLRCCLTQSVTEVLWWCFTMLLSLQSGFLRLLHHHDDTRPNRAEHHYQARSLPELASSLDLGRSTSFHGNLGCLAGSCTFYISRAYIMFCGRSLFCT